MDHVENGMHEDTDSSTEAHKVFRCITAWGTFLKHILTCLYCTKYNEMNAFRKMYKSVFRIQDHTKVL